MSESPDTRSLVSASSQLNLMEIDTVSGTVALMAVSQQLLVILLDS